MPQDDTTDDATWPPRRRAALLVLGAVVAIAAAAVGGALVAQVLTDDYQAGENATYVAPDGLEVELGETVTTNRQNPFPDSSTVDIGPPIEFEAAGEASVRFWGTGDQWLVLDELDVSSNQLRIRPENHSDVTLDGAATRVEVNSVQLDDGEEDLRITTSGETSVRVWGLPADDTVLAIDADSGEHIETIQTAGNGSGSFTVSEDRDVELVAGISTPELTNPQPADGTTTGSFETNLSVDVADGDFPESWGDDVTVTFNDVNDSTVIGSETISSNQTVEVSWSDLDRGSNYWNVTASDEYGNSAELAAMEVVSPNQLVVREENDPQTIVNETELTIRFYTVDGEIAIQRETDDGTLDMSGLPSSDFVVFVESDTHYDRRVYVDDVFDQQDVFVLNSTEYPRSQDEAVASRFSFTDLTGQFPRPDTTVEVERALDVNGDGTSEFRTVAGDFWGAGGEFEVVLERGERYRVVVTNRETGESSVAGTHVPTADLTHSIRTSGLVLEARNASGVYANGEYNESVGAIDIVYDDPTDGTDQLEVRVVPQAGGDPIFNETIDGSLGTYTRSVALNDSQQGENWIIEFESDGHRSAIPVGSGSIGLPVAVPGWLLTLLMSMAVTFVGALYGPRTALMGAWAMVFVAAGVAMFGWAFSGVSVAVAVLVATGATFYARGTI